MYIVHHSEAEPVKSSTACTVYEYCIPDNDINGALVLISINSFHRRVSKPRDCTIPNRAHIANIGRFAIVQSREFSRSGGAMNVWELALAWTLSQYVLVPKMAES